MMADPARPAAALQQRLPRQPDVAGPIVGAAGQSDDAIGRCQQKAREALLSTPSAGVQARSDQLSGRPPRQKSCPPTYPFICARLAACCASRPKTPDAQLVKAGLAKADVTLMFQSPTHIEHVGHMHGFPDVAAFVSPRKAIPIYHVMAGAAEPNLGLRIVFARSMRPDFKGMIMTRSFVAALRRANRLTRPAKLGKTTKSIQKIMTGLMVKSALAPLAALKPKAAKSRKAALPKAGGSLGAVIQQLRAAQSLMPGARAAKKARAISISVPAGAQYLGRTHRSTAGSRGYKLYLPASHPKRPKGLILMLHGCTQSPDDFAVGTHMNALAEKHGLAIAYPAQTRGHNAASCWNWFKPSDQRRGAGEPAILASLARKLAKDFGLGRDAVFVAGLSAGGAMAAILADVYPEVFSAAGIHSGLTRGAARDVLSAMSAMRNGGAPPHITTTAQPDTVRRIVFHGAADSTVYPSNAAMIVAAAVGNDAKPTKVSKRSVRGRGYTRSEFTGSDGRVLVDLWMIEGAGHAWSGGRAAGSYTDNMGPDASAQMVRFFLAQSA